MNTDDNPLDHLPDPNKRYQVFAFTRGAEIWVQIMDDATKHAVLMDPMSALGVAADINLEVARMFDVLGAEIERGMDNPIERGTIPIWRQFISKLGPQGEGKAEQN